MEIQRQDRSLQLLNFQRNAAWVEVHNRAIMCARNLKTAYRDLLEILIEVEAKHIYWQLDVTSLYSYCVDVLLLPEHTAYDFIDVVRTSKEVPELARAVIEGKTTITKARRLCSVITPQNQKGWIELAVECSQKIVQKAVAQANPRAAAPETQKYISGDTIQITFAVSEEWSELLANTKDLMSQKERRAVSTEEALFTLMADYKRKHDPVKKAERAKNRGQRKLTSPIISDAKSEQNETPLANSESSSTRYRPMAVEHEVDLRDQNQCTYVDQHGKRCGAKRWLHKHHIVEFGQGGQHTLENLETLCSAHHRMKHRFTQTH